MAQKTAVEWLVEQLKEFKHQVIDSYISGYSALDNLGDSDQYYTENFKSE